jgi:uncharacterized membrane protein
MNKKKEFIDWVITISLAVLALFITYQVLRIVFGGSWSSENVIMVLVGANLGYSFITSRDVKGVQHDFKNLQRSFNALASDFKKYINDRKIHKL